MTPTPTLIERAEEWLASYAHKNLINSHEDEAQTIIRELLALKSPRPTLDVEGVARIVRKLLTDHGVGDFHVPVQGRLERQAIDSILALLPSTDGWRATHRHVGRGSCYQVIAFGALQTAEPIADETPVTIYLAGNGAYFVRPTAEFNDGRFVALPPPPHSEGGKP